MTYEELLNEAFSNDVEVVEKAVSGQLKGLYADNTILIDSQLKDTEKCCVLAEELGHHYTTSGDILNLKDVMNRKKENLAHNWAIERLIPYEKIRSYENSNLDVYEIAEELNVTTSFLTEAISYYKRKSN